MKKLVARWQFIYGIAMGFISQFGPAVNVKVKYGGRVLFKRPDFHIKPMRVDKFVDQDGLIYYLATRVDGNFSSGLPFDTRVELLILKPRTYEVVADVGSVSHFATWLNPFDRTDESIVYED